MIWISCELHREGILVQGHLTLCALRAAAPSIPQRLPHQPSDCLGLRGLRVGLFRDPSVELGFHGGVQAHADDLADAGSWTPAASFLVNCY
jgi:hypothetical protein